MNRTIDVSFGGGKKMSATVGDKTITTDLPPEGGGEGSAPEPFTLFMASIATCAGLFAINFCSVRNIPTDDMHLTLNYDLNLARKRCDKIYIELKLPPDFPEKYHNPILKAMDLCPVKTHMIEPPEFIMSLT